MIVKPNPPSADHIVKIDLETEIMLAYDRELGELARFAFEVEGKQIYFRTPSLAKYRAYAKKMGVLFTYWGRVNGNVEMPENPVDSYNGTPHPTWDKIVQIMIAGASFIRKMVLELFFQYLDAKVEGFDGKRKWWGGKSDAQKWFEENCRITDLQKVLSACLAVDDMVKKNAIFLLKKEFNQKLAERSSRLTLVKKPESLSSTSIPSQSSLFDSL
jgi:hypothetical protein